MSPNYAFDIAEEDIIVLGKYLENRRKLKKRKSGISFVYDLLNECNLSCRGCAVNSVFVKSNDPLPIKSLRPSTHDIINILDKIYTYIKLNKSKCAIYFGGGEPFLRPDLKDVVKHAATLFGADNIGIDTNGTIDGQIHQMNDLFPYIGYLGISLDGLEKYHDWWRGTQNNKSSFQTIINLLKELSRNAELCNKVEVTSVVTKSNIADLPELLEYINGIGIKKYSVHRCMPVGRMARFKDLVPSAQEYLKLTIDLFRVANQLAINFHIHHSLEAIYDAVFFGQNTYIEKKIGDPDYYSSLGITPSGDIVFDPWSVEGYWAQLSGGNLLNDSIGLEEIIGNGTNSVLDVTRMYTAKDVRCNACALPCSGGSRIAAVMCQLDKQINGSGREINLSAILDSFTGRDPVCPIVE